MPSRRAEPIEHDQAQFPARFCSRATVLPPVMLDSAVLRIRFFQPPSGPLTADEGGERTGDFSKPSALRGLDIAFGLTFTIPSGVRSTPFTRGRGAPLP